MPQNKKRDEAVELRLAYEWDCPECGRQQFHRGMVFDGPPEEKEEIREELGVQPWEEGTLMTSPDYVTCKDCGETFKANDFGESEDEPI